MEKNKLTLSHDREADVAYLSFGEPMPSMTEELDDHVLVRRDPKTREIGGVTTTNFSQYFRAEKGTKILRDFAVEGRLLV